MSRYERDPHLTRFEMIERSRSLRHKATEAERFLWLRINRRQIMGLAFRRQHPIGPYIADFYCPEQKLIIELDGGQHNDEQEKAKDAERTRYLESYGLRVLRFWNSEVFKNWDGVKQTIFRAAALPSPIHGRGVGGESAVPNPLVVDDTLYPNPPLINERREL